MGSASEITKKATLKHTLTLLTALVLTPLAVPTPHELPCPPRRTNTTPTTKLRRIRERLPMRLQELRERCRLSKHGLARESGVSREYLGKIESGKANPTPPVTA